MKRKTVKTIIFVVLANILFFGSCSALIYFVPFGDGGLFVTGVTYEWTNAPLDATSQIYITNVDLGKDVEPTLKNAIDNIPAEISKIPLGNVEILIGDKKNLETNQILCSKLRLTPLEN
jgi:hypothetical protein